MTTESKHTTRNPGPRVLFGAMAAGAIAGLVAALAGAVLEGSSAAAGALVGTAVVIGVFAFGSFAVEVVARVMPALSLLVALLTYTLQLVLMVVVLFALSESGMLGESLDPMWLLGAVILGTAGWMAAQVVINTRLRLPVYDLKDAGAR